MPKRFSTARGREFGDAIRAAVAGTGMTAREICEKIDWDPGKLSDLMNGKGGCTEVDVAILLSFCRIDPAERDHLIRLHGVTDTKDWWQNHAEQRPFEMRTFLEHLWKAKKYVTWMPLLIPGLLQLPEYRRPVCLASATFPQDEMEARIAAHAAMQEVFRQRLDCTFYIHEQALLLPVGGPDVLRAQLHHLLQMLVRPYITIRIVSTSAGAHAGLAGGFELMRFDRFEPVVFLESENANFIIERKSSVDGYEKVLKALDRIALDAEQSQRRISKLAT